jgi:hypothetical protein
MSRYLLLMTAVAVSFATMGSANAAITITSGVHYSYASD